MQEVHAVNWSRAAHYAFLALVLLGGLVASLLTLRSTRGTREHAFMVRHNLMAWGLLVSMIALLFALPPPWRYWVFLPYFLHLPIAIYATVQHQLRIRAEERGEPVEQD